MNQFWPHTVESIVSKSTHSLGKLSIFPIFQQYFIFFSIPKLCMFFLFVNSILSIFNWQILCFLFFNIFFIFQFCIPSPSSSSILLVVPSCPDVHVRNFHPHTLNVFFLYNLVKILVFSEAGMNLETRKSSSSA